jgi:hypothetical protein
MQRRCFDNEALHECASGYVNQFSRHLPGVGTHVDYVARLQLEVGFFAG